MVHRWLLTVGALFLAVALAFGVALMWHTSRARALGTFTIANAGGACEHPITDGTRQIVMSKNDTRSVGVTLANGGRSTCKVTVKLEAPHFQPSSESADISLAPGEKSRAVSWLLTPTDQLGDFQVKLKAAHDEQIIGIRVTSVLGLSAAHAELLTLIGTILGSSGITIPWLYSIFAKRRRGVQPEDAEEAADDDAQNR